MDRKELIEELQEMAENGCGVVEMWEYIEDNSDLDPTEFAMYLM